MTLKVAEFRSTGAAAASGRAPNLFNYFILGIPPPKVKTGLGLAPAGLHRCRKGSPGKIVS
jgi:hypothetical protein